MACTITKGRLVDCKDQLGGLKKVFFLNNYASDFISAATLDGTNANEIDTIGATRGLLQYDLRQDLSSFTVNVQGDPLTGTFLYEQTLSVVLQKITVVDAAQIELLSKNRPQIAVLDNNNNVFVFGAEEGCYLTGGTITSGATRTELTGVTLNFVANENKPYYMIAATSGDPSADKFPFDSLSDASTNISITAGT